MPANYMPLQNEEMAGYLAPWYMGEAERIKGLEEGDRADALGFQRAIFDETAGPAVRDSDVDRMYSGLASKAGRQSLQAQREGRQGFADAGITGGGMQDAAGTGIALQRLGALTEGRAGLKQFQWQENAAHKWRRMAASTGIAQTMLAPRSAVGLDAIGDLLGLSAQMSSDKRAADAAKKNAKDAKGGALLGAGANILSSAIGLV